MDSAEKKAHNVNTRLIERKILKNEAAWILTINGRIKYLRKHFPSTFEESEVYQKQLSLLKKHQTSFYMQTRLAIPF